MYVKNFPKIWKEPEIRNLFGQFGEIERVKIGEGKGNTFAFVCFKEPNAAARAKANLQNQNIEGKTLIINYYELKETKEL